VRETNPMRVRSSGERRRSRGLRRGVLLGALAALSCLGCRTAGEDGRDPLPGSPAERFRILLDWEKEGRQLDAIAEYEAIAAAANAGERDRVRARIRVARCREDRDEKPEARAAYQAILALGHLIADEETLPWLGALPIHFRLEAEHGFERAGGDLILFYVELAGSGTELPSLAAVKALGRLRDPRARTLLAALSADAQTPEELRAAAADALKRIP
jgi:hypothetical protein